PSADSVRRPCSHGHLAHRDLPSFPTRRSSDLTIAGVLREHAHYSLLQKSSSLQDAVSPLWKPGAPDRTAAFMRTQRAGALPPDRSEEHTSELQSRGHLVCRLLLEKKNTRVLAC